MRWIFFTLVSANLLLLVVLWQQQPDPVNSSAVRQLEVPDNSKRLKMVGEQSGPLSSVAVPAGSRLNKPMCYVAGPYLDELNARHAKARAAALGFSGRLKALDVNSDQAGEYWVHVPPLGSRIEAMEVLSELQQRQIDSYIITQGELAEGISLGLFRNKKSAQQLSKRIRKFGINVSIQTINQSQREFWVEINQNAQFNEVMRQKVLATDEGVKWQLVACS